MSENEKHTGYPSVIEYETMSGVLIHVTPLSVFTFQAIREQTEEEFPYPDPEPYKLSISTAADPSIKSPATKNPEYQALCEPIDKARTNRRVELYIEVACAYPAFPTREDMIAHFRPRLEQLRKAFKLSGDEWSNVLNHCVFTGRQDKQMVMSLATQDATIPLTSGEVEDGLRFFRVDVSGYGARKLAR